MIIRIDKSPRYKNAPDEDCVHTLFVNNYSIGVYYGGNEKKYLNPEKWAKEQLKKRNKTLDRNIERLTIELMCLKLEKEKINK